MSNMPSQITSHESNNPKETDTVELHSLLGLVVVCQIISCLFFVFMFICSWDAQELRSCMYSLNKSYQCVI